MNAIPRAPMPLTAPMPAPPVRNFSFTDWQTNNPTAPPPGDKLDSNFDASNLAITQTINWAGVSLNTDGTIRDGVIGESNLVPGLFNGISTDVINDVQPLVDEASSYATSAQTSKNAAAVSATNASASATGAANSANSATAAAQTATTAATGAQGSATAALNNATAAANSANTATGQQALASEYAIAAQAWAEYMPDIIPPNILAVMGITGDHWSARWWANQADQIIANGVAQIEQALNDALDQITQARDDAISDIESAGAAAGSATGKLNLSSWAPNGVLVTFPLLSASSIPITPRAATDILFSIDGVWLEAGKDFTVAGSNISFAVPPANDSNMFGIIGVPGG